MFGLLATIDSKVLTAGLDPRQKQTYYGICRKTRPSAQLLLATTCVCHPSNSLPHPTTLSGLRRLTLVYFNVTHLS